MLTVVTGATGHTGRRIAEALLAAGRRVRVVGRRAERLDGLLRQGAEACAGSLAEPGFADRALAGAEAAYLMVPPADPADPAYRAAVQEEIGAALAEAVRSQGVRHVVNLSSMGADRDGGMLQVEALRRQERRIDAVGGVHVVHLRPAFFMENLLGQVETIRLLGVLPYPLRAALPVPMVAGRDIARVAAGLLRDLSFRGESAVELLGPRDVTMAEATRILGAACGRPDAAYVEMPPEQLARGMQEAGASPDVIRLAVDANESMNAGRFTPADPRGRAAVTPTTLEAFARSTLGAPVTAGAR